MPNSIQTSPDQKASKGYIQVTRNHSQTRRHATPLTYDIFRPGTVGQVIADNKHKNAPKPVISATLTNKFAIAFSPRQLSGGMIAPL